MNTSKGKNANRIRARKLGYSIWNRFCGGAGMMSEREMDMGTGPEVEAGNRAEDLGMG